MYQFILNMWVFGNLSEQQVNSYVAKKFITQEQAEQILATPQEQII
ncbi:XkdX family protein [Sporosarcina globispora]|nr:XkdX family protein [Sporosarcina globispora]